jgi:hypothetical protein
VSPGPVISFRRGRPLARKRLKTFIEVSSLLGPEMPLLEARTRLLGAASDCQLSLRWRVQKFPVQERA